MLKRIVKCSDCGKEIIFYGGGNCKRCVDCRKVNSKKYTDIYNEKYRNMEVKLKEDITDQNAHLKVFMGVEYSDEII